MRPRRRSRMRTARGDGVGAVGSGACPRLGRLLRRCPRTTRRATGRMERGRHRTKPLLGHSTSIRVVLRARTVIGTAALRAFTRSLGDSLNRPGPKHATRRVSACRRPPAPVAQALQLQRRMQSTFSLARVSALLQGYLHCRACIASRNWPPSSLAAAASPRAPLCPLRCADFDGVDFLANASTALLLSTIRERAPGKRVPE
jgi:hypothetical protein